jgi:hypothetical protein
VTYEWMAGGFFLLQRVDINHVGLKITGTEYIGYDESNDTLKSYIFGNTGPGPFGGPRVRVGGGRGILTIWGVHKGSPAAFKGEFGVTPATPVPAAGGGWEAATGRPRPGSSRRYGPPSINQKGDEKNGAIGTYTLVNGLSMYYEVYGIGEPLILLHGSAGAIEMFGEVLLLLAEGRQVAAIDLQAYGRTSDIDRPLNFESMADDVAALIDHLGFEEVDLMGHSLGERASATWSPQHPTNFSTRITTTPWVICILELTPARAASSTEGEASSSARVALHLRPAPDPRESCPAAAGDGHPDADFAQSRRRRE